MIGPMDDATRIASDMDPTTRRSAGRASAAVERITIKQLSMLTGLSVSTLRRRLKDGSIHATQLGGKGKKLLFDPCDWEGPALQGKSAVQSPTVSPPSPQPIKHSSESTAAWMRSAHFLGDARGQKS